MKNICSIPFYFVAAIFLALAFCSCTNERKAAGFYDQHKDLEAQKCAVDFPVKDSIITNDSLSFDTLYLSEPEFIHDSIYTKGDSVVKIITMKCPQVKTITKTIEHNTIDYRENTAKTADFQFQIQKLTIDGKVKDAKITDLKKDRSKWRLWFFILAAINGAYIALKIRKLIPF